MTVDELAEQIIRQIYGPAMGRTWSTNAALACKVTGCPNWTLLEDTLVAMINSNLIRLVRLQHLPNGNVIQLYIPATEVGMDVFDESGFSIEPLPAAREAFAKLSTAASQEA